MKANDLLTENTNLHLTHLEDLALFQGKQGAERALSFLKSLTDLAKTSSPKKFNVTIKWDGSPAIFCGIDPSDGKFFVGTKGVFNVDPKLNKSLDDISRNHPDAKEDGDKAGLRDKLKKAFTGLSKLGIKNVLQGDLLFTRNSLKNIQYDGKSYIAFKPNTLTYAVPVNSELAQKIQQADIGIVFHTAYSGNTLEDMTAGFDVDISSLNKTDDVWYDDAYIKDYTGVVNLTAGEHKSVLKAINDAEKYMQSTGNIFSFLELSELGKKLKEYIHANHNNMVRAGTIEQNPTAFFNNFANDYEQRIEKEIAKLKTGRDGPAGQRKLLALEEWKKSYYANKNNIESWYSLWLKLSSIKNTLYQKLKNIKAIDAFTQDGDTYTVSDQEGFVAVDHVGKAIKVVDRLDFSRKNFSKESLQLSMLTNLTESRAFRSRQAIGDYEATKVGEIVYAYLLSLTAMHREYKYRRIAKQYASRTSSYSNYNFFRTNGTDLYLMIHSILGTGSIVQFVNDKKSDLYIEKLQKNTLTVSQFINNLKTEDASGLERLFVKIERELGIKSSGLKKARRLLNDYEMLKHKERATLVTILLQYVRATLPKSELYSTLFDMSKQRKLIGNKLSDQKLVPKNIAKGSR